MAPQIPSEEHLIAVIGAGVGGLAFAIAATKKWGKNLDFIIYEKSSGIGGTWRANIYPGCSCDVPVHFYSLSGEPNPDFTLTHPFNDEILSYWERLTDKYSVREHIEFKTNVTNAEWIPAEGRYHVTVEDVQSGRKKLVAARVVISALGFLEAPNFSSIPGIENFKGDRFHSAKWDYGIDLNKKKVAVIGNGASSTQFVPVISRNPATQIVHFCRTPNWFLPPTRAQYSSIVLWIFRHIPLTLRLYRTWIWITSEFFYLLVFSNKWTRKLAMLLARHYIRKTAPTRETPKLLPKYEMGCKRVIFDTDYLASLHRPNLTTNWDGIERVVPEGIETKTGQVLPFDVIIFATGYASHSFPVHLLGRDGRTIQDYYDEKKGPTAYMGTTFPHFPNFFMLGGPNTNTGHTSVIYTEEIQVQYALQCIERLLEKPSMALEVKNEACDAYNGWIQSRLRQGVFYSCHSWYRADGTGKVTSIWPGSGTLFWKTLRKVRWQDYLVISGEK